MHLFTVTVKSFWCVTQEIDDVEEMYEKRITPYGNDAKTDAQKKHNRKRVYDEVKNLRSV